MSAGDPFTVVVLASGTGTNLQSIFDKVHGADGIEVAGVGSNNPAARALKRASDAGVETAVFERSDYLDREERDRAMGDWIEGLGADLVVLAGYMELLSSTLVRRFRHKIVNVHPALLPAFPGLRAIDQALEYGVKVTGVTVHFVDEGVDSGPIILQRPIEIYTRDAAELEERIHPVEHELLPEAIRLIAAGRVTFDRQNPRLVLIDEHPDE